MGRRRIYAVPLALTALVVAALVWLGASHLPHFDDSRHLARYLRSFGGWTVAASIFLMILQTLFTPVPLFLVAGANGFIFGVLRGTIITLTGAMIGATVAFYLARYFRCGFLDSRMALDRYRLACLDPKEGPRLVFFARLVPVIPSSVVSYLAGLSRMRFRSFFLVSILGKLPEIVLYTFMGRTLGHPQALNLWVTAGLLLVSTFYFALVAKKHIGSFLVPPGSKN
ncbi:MAG TPA: TVP38/TMEM64 family protein [Spirochaetia bacterium]|nr:TVP38/TMEM64 family protein [Spirochaetia bacterium]